VVRPDVLSCEIEAPVSERRFAGVSRLYGEVGAAAIRSAHIVIVGIGGVGSWVAEGLARSGVGRITLIDMDHLAESNINRQVHALEATLGKAKVLAMQERISQINPNCDVICMDTFVDAENWVALCPQDATAVVDACDQVLAKTAMAAWALRHTDILFLTVGAAGGKKMAHLVEVDDLSETSHDPLLAKVRYQLRRFHGAKKVGKRIGLTCVFSRETVVSPSAAVSQTSDSTLNCHGYGSSVAVTATFGLCAAGWLLDKISTGLRGKAQKKDII
jgi:tRNA A37 threonylcarbamoyladenosine dehydratase